MSLLVFGTSVVSGLEVSYEHYRGSYSNPVMYSPVILSGVLAAAGVASVFSESGGADVFALGERGDLAGWCDRVWISHSRHCA